MPVCRSLEEPDGEPTLSVGDILSQIAAAERHDYFEDQVIWTGSWFLHQWGDDAEVWAYCPVCDYQAMWPFLRGYFHTACPTCGFSNGELEDRDAIRSRIMEQDDERDRASQP